MNPLIVPLMILFLIRTGDPFRRSCTCTASISDDVYQVVPAPGALAHDSFQLKLKIQCLELITFLFTAANVHGPSTKAQVSEE